MKIRAFICSVAVALAVTACATRTAYTTLGALEVSTTQAYHGYTTLVVTGQLPTNSVPTVNRDFDLFQATMSAAVEASSHGSNSVVTPAVSTAAAKVLTDINNAKLLPPPIPGK